MLLKQKNKGVIIIIFYLIQTNFIDLAIIVFLYIFLLTNTNMDKKTVRIFMISALTVNVLIFADSTDYWCSMLNYPTALRYFTSATGYSLRPAPILMLAMVTKRFQKRKYNLLYIPLIINMAIAYTSIFTKWMFYFDAENQFHRGIMGSMPFIVSALYMLILIMWSVQKYRVGDKREASVIFLIALMSVLSVCMETIFKFKFIINGIGGISIVFYYLFLHIQTYKRDALTNALNRHSFYMDSPRLSKEPMVIVSIDINNLKTINDNQGHQMGDKAIITVAQSIEKHLIYGYKMYRMGGDEFMILCPKADVSEVKMMMELIEFDVKYKGYEMAWGMCKYVVDMNFERACSISDARMYEHKIMLKGKNAVR